MATLATSGAAVARAGVGANKGLGEATYDYFLTQAEAHVCAESRYDWITDYASLDANLKLILEKATSCLAAMDIIQADTSNYNSLAEAKFQADVNRDQAQQTIDELKKKEVQKFIREIA